MSTLLVPSPAARHAVLLEDWPGGIVVASDGRLPADAALIAAHKLAGQSAFGVLAVLAAHMSTDRRTDGKPVTIGSLRAEVGEQVSRLLGDDADTWIEIRSGYPPAVLASFAEAHGVALLVVGIGRPRVLERLLGDESTLRLARMTETPIFAVAPDRQIPPRRILVATDFSPTSLRAARLALSVAVPDAEILLAHVQTPSGRPAPPGALRRHVDALQTGFCGRVTPVELQGDAATELLAFASAQLVDAIAIGKQGTLISGRGALGPVATRVVRCANCSVLLAPAHR